MNDVLQDRGLVVISCGYSSGSRISGAATVLQSDTGFRAIFSSSWLGGVQRATSNRAMWRGL